MEESKDPRLEMLVEHVWIPFDADLAATVAVQTGRLTTRTVKMTPQEIIDKFGDYLSTEEFNELKSRL